ncbi:MAG: response regulator [Geobacteraceae bacterium]|nr:response regulator [Geobacteraceae bacterium]
MKKRVLVIEDNEQNLYLVTFLLERNGYRVSAARDGVIGIEQASREIPDLILLDIQLPLLDGYAVAKQLKSRDELVDVPIVAVTSYAMPGDREKALESGCSGYIEKPINPDTFMTQIEYFLGQCTDGKDDA